MKAAVIGCGLRTPLLIHGLAHSGLGLARLVLYDLNHQRAQLMATLGQSSPQALDWRFPRRLVLPMQYETVLL